MKNRRYDMVGYDTLNKLMEGTDLPSSVYPELTKIYEAGMEEMLRHIAYLNLREFEEETINPNATEIMKQIDGLEKELLKNNEHLRGFIFELDSLRGMLLAAESDYFYIAGFLAGYRYLKEFQTSFNLRVNAHG